MVGSLRTLLFHIAHNERYNDILWIEVCIKVLLLLHSTQKICQSDISRVICTGVT